MIRGDVLTQFNNVHRAFKQIGNDPDTYGDKSNQLHHGFKCDRQHHARMLFAGINVAGTEYDDKDRHSGADIKSGVLPEELGDRRVAAQGRCDQGKTGGNGFQL